MSERAPRFASAKTHEGEESSRVKIEVRADEPEKKETAHPKRRRASRAHHTNFHQDHPSESIRAKRHHAETAAAPVEKEQLSTGLTPELENEMRQISKLANLAMEPTVSERADESQKPEETPVETNESASTQELTSEVDELEAPTVRSFEQPAQTNPYELKDISPEEDPEVLTVEAEFIEPEQIDMTPEPTPEAPEAEEVKEAAIEATQEPKASVEPEITQSEHTPSVGDPAELNGEEVLIDNIFADLNGVRVFSVAKKDGSKMIVNSEQLVFIDTEKEKELRAERLKELFDEHSGFLKGMFKVAYIAQRMGNPKDRTIRRGIAPSATYEEQDAAQKANRLSLFAGTQSVSVDDLRTLSNIRANEPLFGTGVVVEAVPVQEVSTEAAHFSQGALETEEGETPLAVSVKALG